MDVLMELTRGQWLYYGGYAGMGLVILCIPLVIRWFRRKKKRTAKRIEEEF